MVYQYTTRGRRLFIVLAAWCLPFLPLLGDEKLYGPAILFAVIAFFTTALAFGFEPRECAQCKKRGCKYE